MNLYFNFKANCIVAEIENVLIDMRDGSLTTLRKDAVLNAYNKVTTSSWMNSSAHVLFDVPSLEGYSSIGGFPITIEEKNGKLKLTGPFPRYFWKGLKNITD